MMEGKSKEGECLKGSGRGKTTLTNISLVALVTKGQRMGNGDDCPGLRRKDLVWGTWCYSTADMLVYCVRLRVIFLLPTVSDHQFIGHVTETRV